MKIYIGIPNYSCEIDGQVVDSLVELGVYLGQKFPGNEHSVIWHRHIGTYIQQARKALWDVAREKEADLFLMLDDDIVFTAQDVEALLYPEAPFVSGLYLSRPIQYGEPTVPVVFDYDKVMQKYVPRDDCFSSVQKRLKVDAVGLGFCLVRKEVIDAIPNPYGEGLSECGEDIKFCESLRKAGFDILVDTRAFVGHLVRTRAKVGDRSRLVQTYPIRQQITAETIVVPTGELK